MYKVDGEDFVCFGLFYDWIAERRDFDKRAVLEIFRTSALADDESPELSRRPDAVIVMMNPGSSTPLSGFQAEQWAGKLAPAKPDAVQYQVMRVMVTAGWHHVRVVNLADMRAAKSADLYARMARSATPRDLGALFAGGSFVTADAVITTPTVICAWGMDKRLAPLARPAQAWLQMHQIEPMGVSAASTFPAYRYPKPIGNWAMAVEWLNTVKAQALQRAVEQRAAPSR